MKPNLLALLVADNVYRDARTGKYIISGTFNKLFFSRTNLNQPVMVDGKQRLLGGMDSGSPYAYLCLSDVRGDTKLMLRYVDLADNSSCSMVARILATTTLVSTSGGSSRA